MYLIEAFENKNMECGKHGQATQTTTTTGTHTHTSESRREKIVVRVRLTRTGGRDPQLKVQFHCICPWQRCRRDTLRARARMQRQPSTSSRPDGGWCSDLDKQIQDQELGLQANPSFTTVIEVRPDVRLNSTVSLAVQIVLLE